MPNTHSHPKHLAPDQEATAVLVIQSGAPVKSIALEYKVAYRTMIDILHRHGVSSKATADPARLRLRERWARNARAKRERDATIVRMTNNRGTIVR